MAAANKPKSGAKSAAKPKKKPAPAPSGIRREIWAAVWGVCGVLTLLALLPIDGKLLIFMKRGLGAVFGYGLYPLPFMLFGLSALLFLRRKGPVRLRAISLAIVPLLLGALTHGFLHTRAYDYAFPSIGKLVADAASAAGIHSGGFLCGSLYLLLEWALSSLGAILVLLLAAVILLCIALRVTPGMIIDMFREPEYEYDSEEEREKYEAPPEPLPNVHAMAAKRRSRKEPIDIPLDEGPVPPPVLEEKPSPAAGEDGRVLAPDEYLTQKKKDEPFHDILDLVRKKPTPAPEPETVSEPVADEPTSAEKAAQKAADKAAAEALAKTMDENQTAPAPIYDYPPLDLLSQPKAGGTAGVEAELKENSARLIDTLESFGIDATIVGIVRGPSVTRFEMTISRGVKFSRITALADDIALSLGAVSVRIAPIPDKVAIGIEVPNKLNTTVFIRECLSSRAFHQAGSRLSFAVGKDITGASVIGDIAKMPHLLIAGTTGSGKSVCVNSMLISLLYKSTPEEVRLIMVDPKMVELGNYNGIPHLLIPVVTDPKKAAGALNWAVGEMERRYQLFADNQVRNLSGYNDLMRQKRQEAAHDEETDPAQFAVLPQIVIVIDELADLMMVAAKDVETSICRIAQKARAAGMHLIVATQRPSADVITGIMKANIPSRIAFAVASQIESRIILDQTGAEKLIGKGDMLYAPLGEGKPRRVQGCFISSDEIEAVIARIKENAVADYNEEILEHIEKRLDAQESGSSGGSSGGDPSVDEDEMLEQAIDVVMECKQASVSMLQRRLKLGYSRAARIVDQMEERGIVGPFEGSKPRQIMISREDWQEMKLRRHDNP